MLEKNSSEALKRARRCLILQPGAIGDCLLTLPLAHFIKRNLKVGAVDLIARGEYAGFLPGRSCIDSIRTIDSVNMHKLFLACDSFEVEQNDELIDLFAGFCYVVSFMGKADSDFERNLIFTVNCSNSSEVILLEQIPSIFENEHISAGHIKNFILQSGLKTTADNCSFEGQLINVLHSDITAGRDILKSFGIKDKNTLIIMHPGAGNIKKCWNLSNYICLAKTLQRQGKQAVFLLGPAELEKFSKARLDSISDTAVTLTQLSLTEVLQVISCADCFIGNDSGITHLAATLGIKTVALFGHTNPKVYRPLGPDVTVIQNENVEFASAPSVEMQQKVLEALDS
ncbi:MAG: glycosyltransferase family 9 protein [Sedimentisphaerales bacterium]|nr:glycosyltransferase family 9 protein [Sedimentisphaerales bacterium]